MLLALADGLTTHVLIGHLAPRAALDLLNAQINTVTQAGPGHVLAAPREDGPSSSSD